MCVHIHMEICIYMRYMCIYIYDMFVALMNGTGSVEFRDERRCVFVSASDEKLRFHGFLGREVVFSCTDWCP